jgi:hypothetical protein
MGPQRADRGPAPDAQQTFDSTAQDVEKQIVGYGRSSGRIRRRTGTRRLARALRGGSQLLERTAAQRGEIEEADMDSESSAEAATVTPIPHERTKRAQTMSTRELLSEITGKATLLVKKEVELARTESL